MSKLLPLIVVGTFAKQILEILIEEEVEHFQ
jgi:hypothetical protein